MKKRLSFLRVLFSSFLLVGLSAQACPTCGSSSSFSPQMLLISTGFVILPLGFAGIIAWKSWKDSQTEKRIQTQMTDSLPPKSRS